MTKEIRSPNDESRLHGLWAVSSFGFRHSSFGFKNEILLSSNGRSADQREYAGTKRHLAQYCLVPITSLAAACSKIWSFTMVFFGRDVPARAASTASKAAGPSKGLHSTVQ